VLYNTTGPFDPEGLLGCLTSILTVFLGFQVINSFPDFVLTEISCLQAGQILLIFEKPSERMIRLLFWAIVYGLISGALCGFSQNEGIIPVNKNLWYGYFVKDFLIHKISGV
jgi:heparan-alpha-glucosaminide N-acetyltransferase